MLSASITIDKKTPENVKRFIKEFPSLTESVLRDTSSFGKATIIRNTPRKTGNARRSWGTPVRMATGVYKLNSNIPPGSNYTPFLEFGTGKFGPLHKVIKAKPGHAFKIPVSFVVKTKIKRRVASAKTKSGFRMKAITRKRVDRNFIFVTTIKGMKPVGMVSKSIPAINEALNKNMQNKINLFWK
jgi:hypothetical protein